MTVLSPRSVFFFFNDTATTEIYTLSLHDALPICSDSVYSGAGTFSSTSLSGFVGTSATYVYVCINVDRKSTRLNSSHSQISYAVFCLKKKKPPHYVAERPSSTPARTRSGD